MSARVFTKVNWTKWHSGSLRVAGTVVLSYYNHNYQSYAMMLPLVSKVNKVTALANDALN